MPNPITGFAPSYNGVTFPLETETTGIQITPVKSEDGRTRVYNIYSITLSTKISDPNIVGGATADNTMDSLRKRLTTPGGAFAYSNMGIGQLSVNVPGGNVRDVVWGPWPEMLSWKPDGANMTVGIVWNVKVAIPDCDNARFQFALMEFNYKLEIDIDRSGYSTRKYSGFLRIPQTRKSVSDRTLSDNADTYRERIVPNLLPGFRRIMGPFPISADKCRLDWSITDEEMPPTVPPVGIIEVKADHAIDDLNKATFVGGTWSGRLSAQYEVARDYPKKAAVQYFLQMLQARIKAASLAKFQGKQFTLLRKLSMREVEIYGRLTASFSATYTFLSNLSDLVKASGLWTPVPNSDWNAWQRSLQNTAFNARGFAKLRFNNADDAIVDLCQPGNATLVANQGIGQNILTTEFPFAFQAPAPPPETSWLTFQSRLRTEVIDQTVELKPLPKSPTLTAQLTQGALGVVTLTTAPGQFVGVGQVPSVPADDLAMFDSYANLAVNFIPPSIVQVRAAPTIYVYLEGYAMRAGWPIAPPSLASVGGVAAVPANRQGEGFAHQIVANYFGVLVDLAVWKLRYMLPTVPLGSVPIPPVPNMGIQ